MGLVRVSKELMKIHKDIYLTADMFLVNKIPFFLTLLRRIVFTAVHHLSNRTVPQIFNAFKEIFTYYLQRGFRITTIGMDGDFAPLKPLIAAMPGGPHVNLTSAKEHVPDIERRIRLVKERSRATRHRLLFQRILQLMVTHMVLFVVKMLNYFPPKGEFQHTSVLK